MEFNGLLNFSLKFKEHTSDVFIMIRNSTAKQLRFMFAIAVALLVGLSVKIPVASAHRKLETSDIFELRSKLEDIVSDKYRKRISTRIPKETFNVSSVVELNISKSLIPTALLPDPTLATKPSAAPLDFSTFPSDITMGSITALEKFRAENNVLKPQKIKIYKEQVRIARVQLTVNLVKTATPKFQQDFTQWLQSDIRSEFGTLGTVHISFTNPDPVIPRELSWPEIFGHVQIFLGLTVLSTFLGVAVLAWKFIPSKDAKNKSATALQIQKIKSSIFVAAEKSRAKEKQQDRTTAENLPALTAKHELIIENHKNHQKKIAYLALSSDELVEQAFDLWLDEADDGRKKLVSVLDCILTERSNELGDKKTLPVAADTWTFPEKIKTDKYFAEIFRNYGALPIDGKLQICEQAYWDLLSLKTIGNFTAKKRFSGVAQLNPEKIENVLKNQSPQVRTVTVMHLPSDKIEAVVSEMNFDSKKAIIEEALEHPTIRESELDVVDQTLEFMVKKESAKAEEVIDVKSMIPNVLRALNAFEEIQVVRDICAKRPAAAADLKVTYPGIAFLADWPNEKIELVFEKLKSQHLLALMVVLPELKEKIMTVIPVRYKNELKDASKNKFFSEGELTEQLEEVRVILIKIVHDKQLDLKKMFSTVHSKKGFGVAS